MTLDSSLILNDTMAPGSIIDLPYLYGPCCGVVHRLQTSCRLWPRYQVSVSVLVATWATDPGCSWAMDSDMAPDSSSVWSTSQPQVVGLATQIKTVLAAVWPLNTNTATGCRPDVRLHVAFGGTVRHGHQHRPRLQ